MSTPTPSRWRSLLILLLLVIAPFGSRVAYAQDIPHPAIHADNGPDRLVEVPSMRTANSDAYAQGGGYITRIFPGSINYQDQSGQWQPIDTTLVSSTAPGYAVESRANAWKVRFPATLGTSPIRVEDGPGWATFSLEGAKGPGTTKGSTETYDLGDYSLVEQVDNDALKESIVLADPSAPHTFTFDVNTGPGLSLQSTASGGIALVDGTGAVVFTILPPSMADAAGQYSSAVTLSLAPNGPGYTITVSADPSWLADPVRSWPVTIDPSLCERTMCGSNSTPDANCYLTQQIPTQSACFSNYFLVGGTGGGYTQRALLHFNLSGIPPDATVSSAQLGVYLSTDYATAPLTMQAYESSQAWTTNATWNTYDGVNAWKSAGGDYTTSPTSGVTIPVGATPSWYTVAATALVQDWVDTKAVNDGLELVATDEVSNDSVQFYADGNTAYESYWPYLQVYYTFRTGDQGFDPMWSFPIDDSLEADVNLYSGNLLLKLHAFDMDGIGIPLTMDAYYNSLERMGASGNLGEGWSLSPGQDESLTTFNGGAEVVMFDDTGDNVTFTRNSNGTYTSPPAIDATLTLSNGTYTLTYHASQEKLIFNSSGLLVLDGDRSGNRLTLFHSTSPYNDVVGITDTQGRATGFTYYQGVLQTITDPAGRNYQFGYDSSFTHLTQYTDGAYPNQTGNKTSFTYTAAPDGNPAEEMLTGITDPDGHQITIGYTTDSYGITRVSSVTETANTASSCPNGSCTTTFSYVPGVPAGKYAVTTVYDANGHKSAYYIDRYGRIGSYVDPTGKSWGTGWTADDQIASTTTPLGHTTRYSYDANNNLTQITYPTGAALHWAYANSAWPYQASSFTDEEGRTTSYGYDSDGRLNSVTDLLNHSNSVAYNSNGTVASETDANGSTTSYSYYTSGTNIGMLDVVTPPAPLGSETMTYDSENRVATDIDGKGQETDTQYDALDRPVSIKYYAGLNNGYPVDSVVYGYDADGNQISLSDATGTTNYYFNSMGQEYEKILPSEQAVSYTYDGEDNLLSKTDSGGTTTFKYNSDDLLTTLTDPLGAVTTYGYDNDQEETSITLPSTTGVSESMSYDPNGNLTHIGAAGPGGAILNSYTYSYTNPATSQATLTRYSMTDAAGNVTSYSYDPLVRLTSAVEKNSVGTTLYSWTYGYDNVGNLTSNNGVSIGYNAADEATTVGSAARTYDGNGNLMGISAGDSFGYNPMDQVTTATPYGGATISNAYTGQGQTERTSRVQGSSTSSYQYDNLGLSAETDNGQETYFTTDPTGTLISEQIPSGASGCPTGGSAWCTYYYLYDGLGSVVGLVDSSGNVKDTYAYTPYGSLLSSSGSIPNSFMYTGAIWDASLGLYKMGDRYYDPNTGAFTQPDPLGGAFAYVSDDPANFRDSCGLEEGVFEPGGGGVGGGGGGAPIDPGWAIPGFPVGSSSHAVKFPKKGGGKYKYYCEATCHDTDNNNVVGFVKGSGFGNSEREACAAAKRDANSKRRQGPGNKRHCRCECAKR